MKLQYILLFFAVGLLLFGCAQGKVDKGATSANPSTQGQVGDIIESDISDIEDPEFGDDLDSSDLAVE